MKIGELARLGGASVETVRYYERSGLLPAPERTDGNYRSYGAQHLERLRLIRNCRALDMSHEEIRGLLQLLADPGSACGAVNSLLDAHIGHVDARILALSRLRESLLVLRHRCLEVREVSACGIVSALAQQAPLEVEAVAHAVPCSSGPLKAH